jgi:putative MATE family efflux protein
MSKEQQQYRKLVMTPVEQLIPRLAVPTIFSMMITMIYNLVDAYFVGKLGTSASAAIGVVLGVQSIFQAFGFMMGHGAGSQISVRLGEGDRDAADRLFSTAFFHALVISVIVGVLGLIGLEPLMRLMGSTDTILPFSKNYGFYILISGPALVGSCVLNNVMRYEGRAVLAMFGLVTGGVLNMIGDPILMFGLGLGIDGAGLSTAISQYISFGILLYMVFSKRTISRLSLRYRSNDPDVTLSIMRVGFPSLIRQMLNSLATITLNHCAMPYGDAAIAAMAIVGRIVMFIGSAMIGLGQGFQPVSAYNYGARKFKRLRDSFYFTVKAGMVVLGILAIFGFMFPGPVVQLFRDDPRVVEIGSRALRFQCIAVVMQPFSVTANMMFQSIGRSKEASFMAMLRSGLYYIPSLLILPLFLGLTGIECAQMVSDILTTLTCIPFVVRFMRETPDEDLISEIDRLYGGA